ncbi:MAG TPA: hypothetical protein VEW03_02975 [Longimicrobiaceae bacterium]|nr:hypothetical protein [Longimicrobiaceae bacterium]
MTMLAIQTTVPSTNIQMWGAFGFGLLIGWYVYYINRYRKGDVQFSDLVTVIGVIGGAGVLALFKPESDLFGAYGIGLAVGFFAYFIVLIVLVAVSPNFNADWFLDGRRIKPTGDWEIPAEARRTGSAMSGDAEGR